MSDKFTVEIIAPNKTILKAETSEVTIPSYEGQIGILKDHIPLITFLRPGIIFIKGKEEKKKIRNLELQKNTSNTSKAVTRAPTPTRPSAI